MGSSTTDGPADLPRRRSNTAAPEPRLTPPAIEVSALADDLRLHDEQLRLMAEWLPQLVWTTKADGTPDWYNHRWFEFTGMPSEDGRPLDKTPFDWIRYVHPDDRERAEQAWRTAADTGTYECEYRLHEAASGDYR